MVYIYSFALAKDMKTQANLHISIAIFSQHHQSRQQQLSLSGRLFRWKDLSILEKLLRNNELE